MGGGIAYSGETTAPTSASPAMPRMPCTAQAVNAPPRMTTICGMSPGGAPVPSSMAKLAARQFGRVRPTRSS
jgi:hypothetical protein